jgi:glucose dehydrogenase
MNLAVHLMLSAVIAFAAPANANENLMQLQENPELWPMQRGNYQGHRYSRLDQITTENVDDLLVAWQFSTGILRGHEGGPLYVGDGRIYIHTPFPNKISALDLKDGRKVWEYEPDQDPLVIPVMCCASSTAAWPTPAASSF